MIRTFKLKHGKDFSSELRKAVQVATVALKTHTLSTADVKQFGLPSYVSQGILRKYSRNKKLKEVGSVKLTINNPSGFRFDGQSIVVKCLGLVLPFYPQVQVSSVNQVVVGSEYAYVSVSIPDKPLSEPTSWIGVDRNATGHIAVVANPSNGIVRMFGAKAPHIHQKYLGLRRVLQKDRKFKHLKKIRDRESRIVRDINRKIARSIVEFAKKQNAGIKLEWLRGIRNSSKWRSGRLHSWSHYQLEQQIKNVAQSEGVKLTYVDARGTSKDYSRCRDVGIREGNLFHCESCGRVGNAHVNGAFNIAQRSSISISTNKMLGRRALQRTGCAYGATL